MSEIFDPVWAHEGNTRAPSISELAEGFACGAADPALFNHLFQVLQSAINAIGGGNPVQTSRQINTSEGVQGGGDLSQDRTFRLHLNGLELAAGLANNDLIVIYDVSEDAHRAVTRSNFLAGLGGGGGTITGGDNIGDGTGEVFSGIDGDNLVFRTLKHGDGLTITTVGDVITIAFSAYASPLTVE